MSNCYIQACTILAGSCSGINTVSGVRLKVTVRTDVSRDLSGVDVAYPWLSNWSCVQWTLHSLHMQRMSAFSSVRDSGTLFPNDSGEDLFKLYYSSDVFR